MKKNLTIALAVLFILSGIRFLAHDGLNKENRPASSFSAARVGGIAAKTSAVSKLNDKCDGKEDQNKVSGAVRIRKM